METVLEQMMRRVARWFGMQRIAWRMNGTGFRGHGSYLRVELAQAWLEFSNTESEYRFEMTHWLESR